MNDKKETKGGDSSALTITGHRTPTTSFNALNLFDEKQLAAAEAFLTKVMRSDKGGIKSLNDGLAIMMRAQDLQLPFQLVLSIFMLLITKLVLIFISLKRCYRGQE